MKKSSSLILKFEQKLNISKTNAITRIIFLCLFLILSIIFSLGGLWFYLITGINDLVALIGISALSTVAGSLLFFTGLLFQFKIEYEPDFVGKSVWTGKKLNELLDI